MEKDKCGIYQIKCGPTGRFYVGSSLRIYQRWYEHRRRLRVGDHHSKKLQHVWNIHGESAFYFIVLEECDRAMLTDREQYWIDKLQPNLNMLLNVTRGLIELNRARFFRITHCPKGHIYDEANTMINQGKRVCRKCNAKRVSAIYASETAEQREARRERAAIQASREKDKMQRALYAANHREEKRQYDRQHRAEANERRKERIRNETPEQREHRLRLRMESHYRNRESALMKMRERYRLSQAQS